MKKIMLILLVFSLIIFNINAQTWNPYGSNLNGEADHDWFGEAIDFNNDGSVIVIGALSNDGNGTDAGHVRVFEYTGSDWVQKGSDIDGEDAGDESGIAVSINAAGNIIAVGAGSNDGNGSNAGHVRIFEYSGSNWVQKGNDIDGDSLGSYSGCSVSLSSNGLIVAIGSSTGTGPLYSGKVKVFEFVGGSWVQKGNDILGDAMMDMFGSNVSISGDGLTLAASSGTGTGYVKIYTYNNSTSLWEQKGNSITGENSGDFSSGASLDMNTYGSVVAIGCTENDDNGTNAGHVRIFEYNGSNWTQKGNDIDGENAYDKAGSAVSISEYGDVVAIGAKSNSDVLQAAGQVRVFKFINYNWTQMGSSINGIGDQDECGSDVCINNNGTILATGSPYFDGSGTNMGQVRVYNNPYVSISEENINIQIYPNPSNGIFYINSDNTKSSYCQIYNSIGQTVFETSMDAPTKKIDISKYPRGIYFISIISEKNMNNYQLLIIK